MGRWDKFREDRELVIQNYVLARQMQVRLARFTKFLSLQRAQTELNDFLTAFEIRIAPIPPEAGFAAIEVEDQLLPQRAHHHIGVERMIEPKLMAEKVRECCAARRSEDFIIIARTNAVRNTGIEDAIRRLEMYKNAGADVLLASPRNAEEARFLGERLPAPLMYLCSPGGLQAIGLTKEEMAGMGWKILADPGTGLFAAYETWRNVYRELAGDFRMSARPHTEWRDLEHEMHDAIDLPKLIAVEKRTVEKG